MAKYYSKAKAMAFAREKIQANEISLKTAFRKSQPWSIYEIETLTLWTGTDLELAQHLCRTYFAVLSAKSKLSFCQSFGHPEIRNHTPMERK